MKPVKYKWRCAASRFCVPICSRHKTKEDCPWFYIKPRKDEFTEDFVPYNRKPFKKSNAQRNR